MHGCQPPVLLLCCKIHQFVQKNCLKEKVKDRKTTHRSFSLLSAGFPCEVHLERSPKFKHRCSHFEQYLHVAARLCHRDITPSERFKIVQMASNNPFNYHSGLWLLLSHTCMYLSQTCFSLQNESIEDSEVDNYLKK